MQHSPSRSRARWLAVVLLAVALATTLWSWLGGGLVAVLLDTGRTNLDKVAYLRDWFGALGPLAPLAYVAAVTVEVVVAPLPGLALYAPGGLIFGGFLGGLLSLAGNLLGALIAFELARTLGHATAQEYLAGSRLEDLEDRIVERGAWIVFLLRVNPLTSSDLVSYAAGLTSMRRSALALGTTAGMAPLCFAQAYAAASLAEAFPWLLWPLIVLAAAYLMAATWFVAVRVRAPRLATTRAGRSADR